MSKPNARTQSRIAIAIAILSMAACQSPGMRTDAVAAALGYERVVTAGAPVRHLIILSPYFNDDRASRIHVYIDGDGRPWYRGRQPARDPTPRRLLALELMARDPALSMYLGRPCYHGLAADTSCHHQTWTFARYSEEVIGSMSKALEAMLAIHPDARATLIGHSGGGVLALLIAERMPRADTVVTIGANLDIDAWAEALGFLPLGDSINPAHKASWRVSLRQIHLKGARDQVVPPHTTRAFAERVPGGTFDVYAEYDHVCCWVDVWPSLLERYTLSREGDRDDAAH
jgi:hypothetical protein